MVLSGLRAAIWAQDAHTRETGDQASGWKGADDEEVSRTIELDVKVRHM